MPKFAIALSLAFALVLPGTAALARQSALIMPDTKLPPTRPAPPEMHLPAPKASDPVKPDQTREAVYWTSRDGKIKLFLVRTANMYSLFVSGGQGLKVSYRTSRNSSQPVILPLTPVKSSGGCLSEYRFKHTFSRTTIWMVLEFTKDGKPLPELKRSFMNGIRPGFN